MVETVDEAVRLATRALVVRGSEFAERNRSANDVLANVVDRASLERLRLALDASETDGALMMPGDPTIVLFRGRAVLLAIQCCGADFIRTSLVARDQRLADPDALAAWLAEHSEAD